MFMTADISWIERFVATLGELAKTGPTELLEQLARDLYPDLNTVRPEQVARLEWEQAAPGSV